MSPRLDVADTEVVTTRRSALSVLLRRTPFSMVLTGCTLAGIQAAAPEAEVPRSYRLRVRGSTLTLRHYGSGVYSPTWSVKGDLAKAGEGVRLDGRQRYLIDRLMTGMMVAFTLFLFGVGVTLAVMNGPGDHEALGALGAGAVIALPTLVILALTPGVARRRQAQAQEVLRGALEGR